MKLELADTSIGNNTFVGIADAHGIDWGLWYTGEEPDLEIKRDMGFMHIRAGANRQRHACFFQVKNINEKDKKVIETLLKDSKHQIALVYIKGIASDYAGGVHILKEHARSWEMIPNPALDPYWHGDETELLPVNAITTS